MTIDRRALFKGLGSAAALSQVSGLLGACRGATNGSAGMEAAQTEGAAAGPTEGSRADRLGTHVEHLQAFLESRGLSPLPPDLDLITGDDYNGGLKYDETSLVRVPGSWSRLHACSRVEDFVRAGVPGVLPHFHILAMELEAPDEPGAALGLNLDYLVGELGLDPQRLVLVGAEWFRPYAGLATAHGIRESGIVYRPVDEVLVAGDGSGYFAPHGHPARPEWVTVSIHHALEPGAPTAGLAYPPDGYLELAEVGINIGPDEGRGVEMAGIGVERLQMARAQEHPSFDESRDRLIETLREEARRRSIEVPTAFESLVVLR